MSRARIAARLDIVVEQIRVAEAGIDAQRGVVAEMQHKGYGATNAETHLTILVANLAVHVTERQRLHAELTALPGS